VVFHFESNRIVGLLFEISNRIEYFLPFSNQHFGAIFSDYRRPKRRQFRRL